jgi:hypothetical protein
MFFHGRPGGRITILLKECSRVTLPRPLPTSEESMIEIRRDSQRKIFRERAGRSKKSAQKNIRKRNYNYENRQKLPLCGDK